MAKPTMASMFLALAVVSAIARKASQGKEFHYHEGFTFDAENIGITATGEAVTELPRDSKDAFITPPFEGTSFLETLLRDVAATTESDDHEYRNRTVTYAIEINKDDPATLDNEAAYVVVTVTFNVVKR